MSGPSGLTFDLADSSMTLQPFKMVSVADDAFDWRPQELARHLNEPLTEAQMEVLAKLRQRAIEVSEKLEFRDVGYLTDTILYRFLHANDWNFSESCRFLETSLTWRKEARPDILHYSEFSTVPSEVGGPSAYCLGVCKEGHIVLYLHVARVMSIRNDARMFHYLYYMMERIADLTRSRNLHYRLTAVLDAEGVGLRHIPVILRLGGKGKLFQIYYADFVHSVLVINSPWVIKQVFKVACLFLDPVTSKKFVFLDRGIERLTDHIDKDQLSVDYGGENVRDVENCVFV